MEGKIRDMTSTCLQRSGRIDILHSNVGGCVRGEDAPVTDIDAGALARVVPINLEGMGQACRHTLPVRRKRARESSQQLLVRSPR
jgi:NAD(P)-dependent dehydrogenase (short-subunit alcohol dehydrogenase family)